MKLCCPTGRAHGDIDGGISRLARHAILAVAVALLAACDVFDDDDDDVAATPLSCEDASVRNNYKPDANTSVVLVRAFRAGEAVALANSPTTPAPPAAPTDLCLVKLVIGPGKPGTAGAPSTSIGIGIEVWLPAHANYNERIRVYGSGGFAGGYHTDPTRLGGAGSANSIHLAAAGKGYVVSTSDHGHQTVPSGRNASFLMNEDGSINTVLWQDFSDRSMHEMADKTKSLARAYYGKDHRFAYWDGFSTGGRQGHKLAQKYPADFDGILAGAPVVNWTRFISSELYPQIVMLRDIGSVIPVAKLNAASVAAVAACGGSDLGFLLDPLQCRYDPTRDAAALCAGVAGNGGVVGTGANATTCLSAAEANAVNKIWYGLTADGTAVDPAVDNASGPSPGSGNHLWFGLTRGTTLGALAGATPFPIASDMVALELQDPTYAEATFRNATGNGADRWRTLDYASLANAYNEGLVLQPQFSDINTDDPNLAAVRDRGAKIVTYHGLADELVMPQGTINYYTRVAATMGGIAEVQRFDRLYLIPGHAHDSTFARSGSLDPATGSVTSSNKVPLPQPASGRDELFTALVNWVENGQAPGRIDLSSADGAVTLPICPYPQKATYNGSGSVTATASYSCSQ